jgi:hypothetical protein
VAEWLLQGGVMGCRTTDKPNIGLASGVLQELAHAGVVKTIRVILFG